MDRHEHDEHLAKLDAIKARLDESIAKYDPVAEARKHAEHMAEMDRTLESAKQMNARLEARVLDPAAYETTVAQARRMAEKETHPTWFQAAYADLAQRLTRVEDRLDELAAGIGMIIGQLAALERQQDTDA